MHQHAITPFKAGVLKALHHPPHMVSGDGGRDEPRRIGGVDIQLTCVSGDHHAWERPLLTFLLQSYGWSSNIQDSRSLDDNGPSSGPLKKAVDDMLLRRMDDWR